MANIIIIGPAHPLRGGLATFDHRLANEFINQGFDCSLYSFSYQYPKIFFPGKTQFSTDAAPKNIQIHSVLNSINPINWIKIGKQLKKLAPDIIIVRYWIPFMSPCLGTIIRIIQKNKQTKIICIADNILPHENRLGDTILTKYFIHSCQAFITMSQKVKNDLLKFTNKKPIALVSHPLYDNFGEPITIHEARTYLNLPQNEKIILFFGFIREYKGLDLLINALSDERILKKNIKLLIAGEFYESNKKYDELIDQLKLKNNIYLHTHFIADSEVKYYICAADVIIQPYKNATQSGVTPLAYNFEKPLIVTNVGGLPDLVPNGKAGFVVEPNVQAITEGILKFFEQPENTFLPFIKNEKEKYSWPNFVHTILNTAHLI